MQEPDETTKTSTEDAQPVTRMDMMLAGFEKWLEKTEGALDEARKKATMPDDIPRFYTRYP